jgi:hypothetical protein
VALPSEARARMVSARTTVSNLASSRRQSKFSEPKSPFKKGEGVGKRVRLSKEQVLRAKAMGLSPAQVARLMGLI